MINIKRPALVDVPVLLLFFNRPDPLEKVFESIRQASPSKLFLVQDGARQNRNDDIDNIKKCRDVVAEVDWECEVYINYAETNLSCDHREFTGISWAFQYVDRLIILEDDCVPSQSFFKFCEELLEKFENDQRMHMISGMSHMGKYGQNNDSYFFSQVGAGNGWATWKRVWENVKAQKDFEYLTDKNACNLMSTLIKRVAPKSCRSIVSLSQEKRLMNLSTGKISSWELAEGISMLLQSQLVILPTKNLISNIGLTADSTHGVDDIRKLSRGIQRVFKLKAYELDFPLQHPQYIIRDVKYEEKVRKIVFPNRFVKVYRRVETFVRKLIFTKKGERKALFIYYIKKFNL